MTAHCLALSVALLVGIGSLASADEPVVGPAKGTLVIIGGGGQSGPILRRFVELAGGPEAFIVIIPTADEEDPPDLGHCPGVGILRLAGAKNFAMLHSRDRHVADTDEFTEPLRRATGVWLGGGRQWRMADAYLGTKTQQALFEVLARGGVIGGSSAGATIQGSFLVRGSPLGNQLMVAPDHLEGFGFLRNCAIDQHVLTRGRQNDLVPVIKERPHLLGIGLDEDTAIIVQGDQCEVVGTSKALFYDAHRSLSSADSPWLELHAGQHFDLKERKVMELSDHEHR